MPGYVYGGLIASLIDCHAMGTAWPRRRTGRRDATSATRRRRAS